MEWKKFFKKDFVVLLIISMVMTLAASVPRMHQFTRDKGLIGFPFVFYDKCPGNIITNNGDVCFSPEFKNSALILDFVVYFIVSICIVYLVRYVHKKFKK